MSETGQPAARLVVRAFALAAALALLGTVALVGSNGGPVVGGLRFVVLSYDLSLPLLALGAGIARAGATVRSLSLVLLAVSLAGGLSAESTTVRLLQTAGGTELLQLLGPLACLTVGVTLLLAGFLAGWPLVLAAPAVGLAVGLAIGWNDPTIDDLRFAWAGAMAGFWIAALPVLLWGRLRWRWAIIAERIVGSWLIAIGVMLAAAALLPRAPVAPPVVLAPPSAPSPAIPETEAPPSQPILPGAGSNPSRPSGAF